MSEKREKILETADRLFDTGGFHATGIDRLVSQSGVARMTLYKHFRTKEDLVLAVLARREKKYWDRILHAAGTRTDTGREAILVIIRTHAHWIEECSAHGCLFIKAVAEYDAHAPRVADAARAHKSRLLTLVEDLVTDALGPGQRAMAQRVLLVIEGMTAIAPLVGPSVAGDQGMATVEALFDARPRPDVRLPGTGTGPAPIFGE